MPPSRSPRSLRASPTALAEASRHLEFVGRPRCQRWSFNEAAIIEALEILDIRRTVVLRIVNARNHSGMHRFHLGRGGYHSITVHAGESASEVGRILWHELTHAWQVETFLRAMPNDQAGSLAFDVRYKRENQSSGYEQNRYEVEARANECMNDEVRLASAR